MKTINSLSLRTLPLALVLGSALVGCRDNPPISSTASPGTSVYDRVVETGTIECAYGLYPPFAIKDLNTGKLSGITVETIEEAAKNLGLKVEWTEEVGFGEMISGLESNRYDVIGSGVWANASRAKQADFSIPFCYSALGIYVRPNDRRFDNNLAAINSPSIRISTIDGEMGDIVASTDFPQATKNSLPQNADYSRQLLDVSAGKADIAIVDPASAALYLEKNPGTLRNITKDKPIRVFPTVFMFKRNEFAFKQMLDNAIQELINNGTVDKIISKHEPAPGTIYRPRETYSITR